MERKAFYYGKYGYRLLTGTVQNTVSLAGGKYQYISALNAGKYVPGQFRLNPVLITKTAFTTSLDTGTVTLPDRRYAYGYGPILLTDLVVGAGGPNLIGRNNVYWDDKVANLALVTAYSRMNSPEFFDGGTFLGELSETIGMLRNPISGIRRFLRKKKFRDPRRLVNASADTLMEFRYGIRPLLKDFETVVKMFNKSAFHDEVKVHSSKGVAKPSPLSWTGSGVRTVGDVLFPFIDRGTRQDIYTSKVFYRKRLGFSAECHRYGLSLQNIPSVGWELTPLSFVVDWFVQVGPWIRAMTPNPSVTILGNCTSRKTSEQCSRVVTDNCYLSSYKGNRTTHRAGFQYDALNRVVNSALPALPVRTVDSLEFLKKVDSIALLWQRLPSAWIRPR